jgi:hypothetical protein
MPSFLLSPISDTIESARLSRLDSGKPFALNCPPVWWVTKINRFVLPLEQNLVSHLDTPLSF